jgi:hypothetical protein
MFSAIYSVVTCRHVLALMSFEMVIHSSFINIVLCNRNKLQRAVLFSANIMQTDKSAAHIIHTFAQLFLEFQMRDDCICFERESRDETRHRQVESVLCRYEILPNAIQFRRSREKFVISIRTFGKKYFTSNPWQKTFLSLSLAYSSLP